MLVIVAVAVVAALVARHFGRRSAFNASWRAKVADAYAKGSALHDAMSMAEAPGALAAPDAGARWTDIQRRADDLTQVLYALRDAAPGEEDRLRVAEVLASLQALRSAADAEHGPGGTAAPLRAHIDELLRSFQASLNGLRTPGDQDAV